MYALCPCVHRVAANFMTVRSLLLAPHSCGPMQHIHLENYCSSSHLLSWPYLGQMIHHNLTYPTPPIAFALLPNMVSTCIAGLHIRYAESRRAIGVCAEIWACSLWQGLEMPCQPMMYPEHHSMSLGFVSPHTLIAISGTSDELALTTEVANT